METSVGEALPKRSNRPFVKLPVFKLGLPEMFAIR